MSINPDQHQQSSPCDHQKSCNNLAEPSSSALLCVLKSTYPGNYKIKKHGKSFNFAQYFIPRKHACAIKELYEICRLIDNIADCPKTDITVKENQLSHIQDLILDHNDGDSIHLSNHHTIRKKTLCTLVIGAQYDLNIEQILTMDNLMEYCYHVAGTVGLMMCDLMNITDQKARHHAIDLGIAMQLTNIARDVYKDAKLGRIYLPSEVVGKLHTEQLIRENQSIEPTLSSGIRHILHQADQFYASGFTGLRYIPYANRFGIYIAAKLYQTIGKKVLKNNPYQPHNHAYVPLWEKQLIALQCIIRFIRKPSHLETKKNYDTNQLYRNLTFYQDTP